MQKGSIYLKALNSAFEEHKEGGVWINGLSFLKNGLGFLQAPPGVCPIQSKERLHYCVVPQEGQAGKKSTQTVRYNRTLICICCDDLYITVL